MLVFEKAFKQVSVRVELQRMHRKRDKRHRRDTVLLATEGKKRSKSQRLVSSSAHIWISQQPKSNRRTKTRQNCQFKPKSISLNRTDGREDVAKRGEENHPGRVNYWMMNATIAITLRTIAQITAARPLHSSHLDIAPPH
jgi:hypothetical protein